MKDNDEYRQLPTTWWTMLHIMFYKNILKLIPSNWHVCIYFDFYRYNKIIQPIENCYWQLIKRFIKPVVVSIQANDSCYKQTKLETVKSCFKCSQQQQKNKTIFIYRLKFDEWIRSCNTMIIIALLQSGT